MKVSKVDNNQKNNTSFKWVIPLKNVEKKCGISTLRFSDRLNGLDRYDVYIKPLETKTTRERDLGCLGPVIYAPTIFLSAIGGLGGANYLLTNYFPNLTGGFIHIGAGILSGLVLAFGIINTTMFKKYNDFSIQAATQRGKNKDGSPMPAGIVTKEHIVKNDNNRYNSFFNFAEEIEELKKIKFQDFIRHYDTNDLFEAKNYARVLKNRPEGLDSEFFNYKIDDKGNTLLTAFFDVVPNGEEYSGIIKYLKDCMNLDFNQRDGNGISCIEKVLLSENKEALDLILNTKYTHDFGRQFGWDIEITYSQFRNIQKEPVHNPASIPYSPEFDDAYNNIQDKEFKKMVDDNIKWDFSNWIAVIKSHDVSKAEKLKKRFNSPLLDKQQLYNDINKALSNCNDMNFITYMQTNFLRELVKTEKES